MTSCKFFIFALALGSIAGQAAAAEPAGEPGLTFHGAAAADQSATGSSYYLRQIPGTNKTHKVYYFDALDKDNNGRLSRSELPRDMVDLRLRFRDVDWNRDGQLSADEYRMYRNNESPRYTEVWHGNIATYN